MATNRKGRYNKRNRGRKGRGRRNYNNRYNFTYGNVLDKVITDVAKLKGLVNTEFKQSDATVTGVVSSTAGFVLLNGMVKGDDFDTRDGRQIRVKSVQLSIRYVMSSSATFSQMRCIIFIDKQPNEITPVVLDLLDSAAMQAFRNLDQRKRFVILYNNVVSMSINGMRGGMIDYYKRLDMKTVFDDSDAGDITDISTNAIWLMLISTEATNTVTISRSTRIRYIDN